MNANQNPSQTAWNQLVSLTQMENTVRRMTARYSEAQMPTSQIDYYINLAYTLKFPQQFKNMKLTKPLVFNTIPNIDTYQFVYQQGNIVNAMPSPNNVVVGNISISPPAYCQGYILRYYQDKSLFYNVWPRLSVNQIVNSGNGQVGFTYTGNIPSKPFYRAQQDIFGNVTEAAVVISSFNINTQVNDDPFVYVVTDIPQTGSNVGNLVDIQGNIVGSVDYITGAYTLTPVTPNSIPQGEPIYAAVIPYQSSRPVDVLFYNNQLVLRPCPMQVYQMEFQINQQPTQVIANNEAPELDEWWLLICCLAAELIYLDFPDEEGMAYLQPELDKQIGQAQRRTLRQLGTQRANTIFSAPGWSRTRGSYFFGQDYSGSN